MEVNIGTVEKPIYVPESATKPDTKEGNEWWEMLASGSVTLGEVELGALFAFILKQSKSK